MPCVPASLFPLMGVFNVWSLSEYDLLVSIVENFGPWMTMLAFLSLAYTASMAVLLTVESS